MRVVDLIETKKRGGEHPPGDVRRLIHAYHRRDVPDYQMAAWLMAVRWRGMSLAETEAMTWAMAESGETLDLDGLPRPRIDKHSTGGVGDKLTLVVVPLLVAAGATVIKLSGRGLGHTGGTIDKLEAIPGIRLFMDPVDLMACARRAGGCLAGHSASLVPADGMVYALRDATATVDSLPLIAASIMSKKLAAGADTIVFDVKVGRGGLLGDLAASRELAAMMTGIAARAGKKAIALLTAMDQPLGAAAGNAVEVNEAVQVLRGAGPPDVRAASIALAGAALAAAGAVSSDQEGQRVSSSLLDSGAGLHALGRIISTQGGDAGAVLGPRGLGLSRLARVVEAPHPGTIVCVDALAVGRAAVLLGAGRSLKGEQVDPGAGVILHVRSADNVAAGQPLATVYASDEARLAAGAGSLEHAFEFARDPEGDRRDAGRQVAIPKRSGPVIETVRPGQ
jgi:pyrimidine-nucleoside phosphorylase